MHECHVVESTEQIFVVTAMDRQLGVIQGDIVIEVNGQIPAGNGQKSSTFIGE